MINRYPIMRRSSITKVVKQEKGEVKMKRLLIPILVLAFIFSYAPPGFAATDEEIQILKQQVQQLLQRIDKLEADQAKTKEDMAKAPSGQAPKVDLSNTLSKLKMKGRFATGYYKSETAGSFPSGSFEMPDAKIQFSFQPDEINTVVMRFKLDNGVTGISTTSPLLDYFYLQSKDFIPSLKDTPFSLSSRLGRFKLGFGEETWSDNPVEGVLPSNSAAKTGVSDEGLELAGKIKLDKIGLKPLGWVTSVSNGNNTVGSDSGQGKAFLGKLYYTPIDPLYLSASYYDSGRLKLSNSEFSIAGLAQRPTNATDWERKVWEIDARYDFGKGKKPLDPPAYSDSKAIVRLSYGGFHDITSTATTGLATAERAGNFGFIEGTYNLTKKIYTAGRFSFVNLDNEVTASLNSVTANTYDRYSLGMGYRWSDNTIVKLGYDWNEESGPSTNQANNDQLTAIVSTQF
ncbi:MAG: hypothetical protein A2047_02190 [Omnitrophica bacterium GWA2_41_15]|nr:MAG: hypothetical protein A2047_02190 [Omnitrophica bacterium GWA2_41_15]HAZ10693.1 hypothetical protein [Candidatus Omnitrophota bacterium]